MVAENESKKEDVFIRQQYGKVCKQAAVKICNWTKRAVRGEGNCYKHYFYGISCLGCLEMSPVLVCNQRCRHCWRDQSLFAKGIEGEVDDPKKIIEGCIKERKKLLIGFGGNEKVDTERFEKCLVPRHAAISLTGEPCLYPKLPELVKGFYEKGFESVFVVTNGIVPSMLKRLGKVEKGPTNIYLSVEWWDKESYLEFCRPLEEGQYEKILESMEVLKGLREKVNTVLRITCIRGFNMEKVKEFKWMVKKMRPKFIECKGYMFVGYSRKRMEKENMPEHFEVREFANRLGELTGYKVKGEQEESWVVLLGE